LSFRSSKLIRLTLKLESLLNVLQSKRYVRGLAQEFEELLGVDDDSWIQSEAVLLLLLVLRREEPEVLHDLLVSRDPADLLLRRLHGRRLSVEVVAVHEGGLRGVRGRVSLSQEEGPVEVVLFALEFVYALVLHVQGLQHSHERQVHD